MFEVEQKIDWSLINENVKDRELLKAFFIDGESATYGIVGNTDYVIVRSINNGKPIFYVQKRTDYVKQQNGFYWNTGAYKKD